MHYQNNKINRAGLECNFEQKYMMVNINCTDLCNFSCSYCVNTASYKKRILDKNILLQLIEDISIKSLKRCTFAVAGEEPLLYPHIFDIVKTIDKINCDDKTIWITTNGSLLKSNINYLYKYSKSIKFKFTVSTHLEQIDINRFSKQIDDCGHKNDIKCKIITPPNRIIDMQNAIEVLHSYGLSTFISPVVYKGGQPYSYTDEEKNFLYKNREKMDSLFFHESNKGYEEFDRIIRGLHPEKFNYQGMFCTAGMTTLRLAPDGTLSRCFGFLRLGEIFDLNKRRLRDIPELAQPCICPAEFCSCLTFLQAPKWRKKQDTPIWL